MALEIKFDLHEDDFDYFRNQLRQIALKAEQLPQQKIIESTNQLLMGLKPGAPKLLRRRLNKLDVLMAMIEDTDWQLPQQEKRKVLVALHYFNQLGQHQQQQGLGFFDEAIMIELVVDELKDGILAFNEFCRYRQLQQQPLPTPVASREMAKWLQQKRCQLHSRMRARRKSRKVLEFERQPLF